MSSPVNSNSGEQTQKYTPGGIPRNASLKKTNDSQRRKPTDMAGVSSGVNKVTQVKNSALPSEKKI